MWNLLGSKFGGTYWALYAQVGSLGRQEATGEGQPPLVRLAQDRLGIQNWAQHGPNIGPTWGLRWNQNCPKIDSKNDEHVDTLWD